MPPFKLHTVLKHRQRLEDTARNRFIEAKEAAADVRKRYAEEQKRLTALIAERDQRQQQGIDITMLLRFEEMITRLTENIAAIKTNLEDREKLVGQMHANLLSRTGERRIMEQLRDEQNRAWKQELEKREAKMLDEIAVMRHNSRS